MAFQGRAAYPASDQGYARGMDFQAAGSGSGQGIMAQGTAGLSQGIGSIGGKMGSWEPSVLYLFALVTGELIFFHVLARILK